MGCPALLCGRFDDSQESRFLASKRSNMGSAVLQGRPSAVFPILVFSCKTPNMDSVEVQGGLFVDCKVWHFQVGNVQIRAEPSCKRVDLLMFKNSSFTLRNVEICAVLSKNKVHFLMLRNRVFRQRNDQKCAVES